MYSYLFAGNSPNCCSCSFGTPGQSFLPFILPRYLTIFSRCLLLQCVNPIISKGQSRCSGETEELYLCPGSYNFFTDSTTQLQTSDSEMWIIRVFISATHWTWIWSSRHSEAPYEAQGGFWNLYKRNSEISTTWTERESLACVTVHFIKKICS